MQKNNYQPLITVITVVYNSVSTIEDTMLSVLNQSYPNVEYIVIDGGSTDGTVDIIKKYAHRLSYWVSEKDKGIFDAMNKGISRANGLFTNFLNSGDVFYSTTVLSDISVMLSGGDVFFGDAVFDYDFGRFIIKASDPSNVIYGAFCCHQSVFIKTDLMKKYRFNTDYRIISDWILLRNLYLDEYRFISLDKVVSVYECMDGVSASPNFKLHQRQAVEKATILYSSNALLRNLFLLKSALKYVVKRIIKYVLPKDMYQSFKRKRILQSGKVSLAPDTFDFSPLK